MENIQPIDNFRRKLAHVGLKLTRQRKLIFMALLEQGALTTPEIATLLSGSVDRATVYRTLETFEEIKLVDRIWDGWKSKIELSDAFVTHHHHATCSSCEKGMRIESAELETTLRSIAKKLNFNMDSHTVELYGTCEACTAYESHQKSQ